MLFILRNFQSIILKRLRQHWKIEAKTVMRNNRLVFDKWFNPMPDFIESGCVSGHFGGNVMDAGKPVPVEVVGRLHQNAEFIGNYAVFNPYYSNLADAPAFAVCGFKINGGKCFHCLCIKPDCIHSFHLMKIKFILVVNGSQRGRFAECCAKTQFYGK